MSGEELATAHQIWDSHWTSPETRNRWLQPEPSIKALVATLRERSFARVLDVGCGPGRHAQYLAQQGFRCAGVDASETALEFARAQAAEAGLSIDYRASTFYDLPFADRDFDVLIAWNVIYHGDRAVVQRATSEFARVVVPGALYVATMLSKRNTGYGKGREVSQDTFVVDDALDDKIHPHLYVSAADVLELHPEFEVLTLEDVAQAPGQFHWHFSMERR